MLGESQRVNAKGSLYGLRLLSSMGNFRQQNSRGRPKGGPGLRQEGESVSFYPAANPKWSSGPVSVLSRSAARQGAVCASGSAGRAARWAIIPEIPVPMAL